jgi:glycosyltransferase involved in cell wall biosynthesis
VRVAVDVTPLFVEPRGGVARALAHRLDGWLEADGADAVLVGPRPFPSGASLVPAWRELVPTTIDEPPTRFRRRAAALVAATRADAWLSPFAAFPDLDVPTVVTVHEAPFVRLGPVEGRLRAWRHRAWIERAARRGLPIVVPSRATADDVLALRKDADVRVVAHGFDPAPWRRAAERARVREGHAIAIGCTHERKGIATLVAALERLHGLALVWTLVGRPPPRFAARVEARGDVGVLDAPSDDALARELASSSFLVYPSLSEGFGYPPLEAMAASVPVVATRAGAISEVVLDAALLVPPGDAGALADAIRRVATDEALRRDLVARGSVRADAFPPVASARAVIDVLAKAAARR